MAPLYVGEVQIHYFVFIPENLISRCFYRKGYSLTLETPNSWRMSLNFPFPSPLFNSVVGFNPVKENIFHGLFAKTPTKAGL